MKHLSFKLLLAVTSFAIASVLPSCGEGPKLDEGGSVLDSQAASQLPDTTIMTDRPAAAGGPAVPMDDDATLTNKVKDATKDFEGVTATVNNGEVTLTGTIQRDRLPQLMQNVNNLNPKKVNNNLTVK